MRDISPYRDVLSTITSLLMNARYTNTHSKICHQEIQGKKWVWHCYFKTHFICCLLSYTFSFISCCCIFSDNYLLLSSKNMLHFCFSYYFAAFTILLISQTKFPLWEHLSHRTATTSPVRKTEGNQQSQIEVVKLRSLQEHGGGCCDVSAAGVGCEPFVVDSVDVLLGQGIDARQTSWGKDAVAPPGREQTLHSKPGNTQAHTHM